jgi:hypothetical protein
MKLLGFRADFAKGVDDSDGEGDAEDGRATSKRSCAGARRAGTVSWGDGDTSGAASTRSEDGVRKVVDPRDGSCACGAA